MSMAAGMGWPSYNSRRSDEDCCDWWYDRQGIMGDCRGCFNQTHDCLCDPAEKIPCGPIICVACCVIFSPVTWICACTDAGDGKPEREIDRKPPQKQAMRTQRVAQSILPPLSQAPLPVNPQVVFAQVPLPAPLGEVNPPQADVVDPDQLDGEPEVPVPEVLQVPEEGAGEVEVEEGAAPNPGINNEELGI